MNSSYRVLGSLVKIYFGQDFHLFGDSFESIMEEYRRSESAETQEALRDEILEFMRSHPDLDAEFQRRYDYDWDPENFGPTARDFLENVLKALQA